MNIIQKRKILQKITELDESIETLKAARIEAVASGFASATISSSGGSKSYTRLSPEQITKVIDQLLKELAEWRSLLTTGDARKIKTIATIYI